MVLTAWGSDVLLLPDSNRLMRQMVSGNLRAATAITSDSLYMAAKIRQLAGEDCRIDVLNFGMDALPAQPDIAAKANKVLSCRLHKPLYRIDAILHAWQQVEASGRYPDWSLTVAASGESTDSLKALASRLQLQGWNSPALSHPPCWARCIRNRACLSACRARTPPASACWKPWGTVACRCCPICPPMANG
jgi:hypothetical protein